MQTDTRTTIKPLEVLARRNGHTLQTDGTMYYVTRAGTSVYLLVTRSMTEAAKFLARI